MPARGGKWFVDRVAKPVLRRLLRSPLGRVAGRRLAVLRYPGRRTGRPHELVVRYARDGGTVWVLVGAAGKTWWRNLREPSDVELWLAGEHRRARARVVTGAAQPDECAAGLATYLAAVPHAAAALGLPGNAGTRRAALSEVVGGVVLVRADLA